MSYRRTKLVKIDNAEFMISSLTVEQVEEYLSPLEDMAGSALITVKNRTHQIIANGLNNVHMDEDGNVQLPEGVTLWNIERIRKALDLITIDTLNREVLLFSGLKIMKAAAEGESQAASNADAATQPPTSVM